MTDPHWKIESLPYEVPALQWLQRLRGLEQPFMLSSGDVRGQRYDFIGAAPRDRVVVETGPTTAAFGTIEALVHDARPQSPCPLDLPFTGGAVGYFAYEVGYDLEAIGAAPARDSSLPPVLFGIYDWFIVRDRASEAAWIVGTPAVSDTSWREILDLLRAPPEPLGDYATRGEIRSSLSRAAYDAAIREILSYIHAGDCYQVNLTQRFNAFFDGDILGLFDTISASQRAPYGACLLSEQGDVLSFSPERFLQVGNGRVVTQPIKGTRPRGATAFADAALARELAESDKDRAENLMIVDLLRNDIGRCSETGSVRVDNLFELQTFDNVHHLVSTVSARLRADVSPLQLLRHCFPGGSVTGAPKIRAMQIIAELEPVRRETYCGAIGYYSYSGSLDTNLPIRTLVHSDGQVRYWGGGGIVADSTADAEYEESLAKVAFIRAALEQPRQSAPAARRTR